MRQFLLILALLLLSIPVVVFLTARLAVDADRKHSGETRALPFLAADPSQQDDGVVQVRARGFVFRARVAGLRNSGPAVLLLHGFPETSLMWERLLESASAAGFRVVAFDQRGYSPGARPSAVDAYALPEIAADAMAMADRFGFDRFHLVGHDWGSIVGWSLTPAEPERVLSWTSLSIPHPKAILEAQETPDPPAYFRFFRQPGLPETLFMAFDQFLMKRMIYRDIPSEHSAEYLRVLAEAGAFTAALNWYRALRPGTVPGDGSSGGIQQPVLYIWGNRDMPTFVNPRVQQALPNYLSGPFESIELDAGHWLIEEEPTRVVDAIVAHLQRQ